MSGVTAHQVSERCFKNVFTRGKAASPPSGPCCSPNTLYYAVLLINEFLSRTFYWDNPEHGLQLHLLPSALHNDYKNDAGCASLSCYCTVIHLLALPLSTATEPPQYN